jgi:23S rRNA pseudouridine1911/1915/1917 synthase
MAPRSQRLIVPEPEDRVRLDELLAVRFPLVPRREVRRRIRSGEVRVNGQEVQPGTPVRVGDVVELDASPEESPRRKPAIPGLEVLHEDPAMVVVDKPAGLSVTPERGTVVSALLEAVTRELARRGGAPEDRPRVVHRLDRDTSGVLALARTVEAARHLSRQWFLGSVEKEYLAVVEGEPAEEEGVIEVRLARTAPQSQRMSVVRRGGKSAITGFRVLERFRGFAFLTIRPKTGRMHQIRVHLAHVGHPLVGDDLYGGRPFHLSAHKASYKRGKHSIDRALMARQALHATKLRCVSPFSEASVTTEAPLPRDFESLLRSMRKYLSY